MQIHSFVSRFHLQHFTCLRALALDHLHSSRTISTVIGQCHQLIHLDLTHCLFSNDDPSVSDPFNTIWSLRNLVRCHIDIRFKRGMEAILPTVISTSLQDLTIESFYYGSEHLARLFQHTPYLRHLRLVLSDDAADESLRSSIPSIIRLRFSVYESLAIMSDLLRKLPNLHYLTAETDDLDWDGHSWQQMITDRLPKLKRFRLYMILRFTDDENKEQRVDRLFGAIRIYVNNAIRTFFISIHYPLLESTISPTKSIFEPNRLVLIRKTMKPLNVFVDSSMGSAHRRKTRYPLNFVSKTFTILRYPFRSMRLLGQSSHNSIG